MDYSTVSKISESLLWTLNEAVACLFYSGASVLGVNWNEGYQGLRILLLHRMECSLHPMEAGGVMCEGRESLWPFDHTHQEFTFFNLEEVKNAVTCPSLTPDWELRGEGAPFLNYTLPELNFHQAALRLEEEGMSFDSKPQNFCHFY